MTTPKPCSTIHHAGFFWTYDASTDVLHVTKDPGVPTFGSSPPNFENLIVVLRAIEDDALVGVRVIGAKKNGLKVVTVQLDRAKGVIKSLHIEGAKQDAEHNQLSQLKEIETVEDILGSPPPALQLA